MSEETPKIGTYHTLPTTPISLIKLLPYIDVKTTSSLLFQYFNQPQKNISRKLIRLIQKERLYLFYVGRYGSTIKDIIEIQSLRSRSHGLNLHLHWHVCVFYQSFAFQHVLFSLCVCVEENPVGIFRSYFLLNSKNQMKINSLFQNKKWQGQQ